jgi:hypothetical protein
MDLLNLARTTKEIRGMNYRLAPLCFLLTLLAPGILMTRSNAFIWRESRSQIEGLFTLQFPL